MVSRQREWQKRKLKEGLCIRCGAGSGGKKHCDSCRARVNVEQKKRLDRIKAGG